MDNKEKCNLENSSNESTEMNTKKIAEHSLEDKNVPSERHTSHHHSSHHSHHSSHHSGHHRRSHKHKSKKKNKITSKLGWTIVICCTIIISFIFLFYRITVIKILLYKSSLMWKFVYIHIQKIFHHYIVTCFTGSNF